MRNEDQKFCFLDLETTGLDVNLVDILELAILVTNSRGEILGEFSTTVMPKQAACMGHPISKQRVLSAMCEGGALDLHLDSGLLQDLCYAPERALSLPAAEKAAIAFINKFYPESERPIIMGAGIAYDKAILYRLCPALAQRVHYRTLDLSAVVATFGGYLPDMPEREPVDQGLLKHRALNDCKISARVLSRVFDQLLRHRLDGGAK